MTHLNFSQTLNSSLSNDELEIWREEPGTEYFVLAPALGIITLLAIFGNMTLIVTICRTPSLRTRTNMFILNLACADVGVALLCMPFSIITFFTRDWIFGDSLCQLNGFMNILFEVASLFTLTAISIEKYFSIVKPMTVVITTRLAWTMVVTTWLTALVLATIPLTGFIAFDLKPGSTQCGVQVPATIGQTVYAFVVVLVAFLIPLCIMGFCYVNIFRAAREHTIRLSRMSFSSIESEISLSSQSQIALTIFIMFIVFVLCWTPYFAYMMYMTAHHVKTPDAFAQNLGLASYWCAFLNSCINPFVYGVRNPLIRKELYSMCCGRFQNGRRRNSLEKKHAYCDSYLGPPRPYTGCNETSLGYPAYINVVALSEEDIVSPNEGIGKLTMDRETQTGQDLRILSFQELPNVYLTNEPSCVSNETLSSGFITLPIMQQDRGIHTESANEVTCSTCSSACSESDHVIISSTEEDTCSSESIAEVDSLCSDCESGSEDSTNTGTCSCDGDEGASSCSSQDVFYCVNVKNTKKVYFLSTKVKTIENYKIGWIESQI